MKVSINTVECIIATAKAYQKEVDDFEAACKELRGKSKDWEHNIESDERMPVKLLYAQLKEKREIRDKYLRTQMQVVPDSPMFGTRTI